MEPVRLGEKSFAMTVHALREAEKLLQEAGAKGKEALVLLAGHGEGQKFILDLVLWPDQIATAVSVRLLRDSMSQVHAKLAERGRIIGAQVHTHPGQAFHTETDDADTTVTQLGSLSIVVPYFCRLGLRGWPGCVAYVLEEDGWSSATYAALVVEVQE